jgi:pyruvate dehydrogenase E1 component alpha subunit
MDIDIVQASLTKAVDRARSGNGPTFIEAKTYRFSGHSRADTAPYRPDGELDSWADKDPLLVTERKLIAAGGTAEIETIRVEEAAALDALITVLESAPLASERDMFEHVWA